MLTELFIVGGIFFWIITAMFLIIIFSALENMSEISVATIFFAVYLVIIGGLTNFTKEFEVSITWWHVLLYLGIGCLWFLTRMTSNLRKLKRWIDSKSDSEEIKKSLSKFKYCNLVPSEYRRIYESEPSFSKFFDRVILWPFCVLKYIFADLCFDIYSFFEKSLVKYKNSILGIE